MENNEDIFKKIISYAKEYGFVFQSSEIYDGLRTVYDYGLFCNKLKDNIKFYLSWLKVPDHENIVDDNSAIFMHSTVRKATGFVDAFCDPMIDIRDSKKR